MTEVNGAELSSSIPIPSPAALGLGPDDNNQLVVPEQLRQLVQTRKQWVELVGGVFEAKQREEPGRVWGLPLKSVFEGIDEQVQPVSNPASNGTHELSVSSDNSASRTTMQGQDDLMDVR
jgi:transcriptional adapter 3